MSAVHALAIEYTGRLVTFNRAVGMLRRRNVRVKSLAVGPVGDDGHARLTVLLEAEREDADRLALLFRNVVGVEEVRVYPVEEVVAREIALITLHPSDGEQAELLDTLQLYGASVVDDGPGAVVAEITGGAAFVLSFLRALERFRIVDVARSGTVAVPRTP